MKKDAKEILNLPMSDGETSTLESMQDVNGANLTVAQAVLMKQVQMAMKGSTEAAMFVQSVLGDDEEEESAGIAEAAQSGDTLKLLQAMKNKLASQLDTASPREASALSRQLLEINDRIDKLEKDAKNKQGENPLNVILTRSNRKRQGAARTKNLLRA